MEEDRDRVASLGAKPDDAEAMDRMAFSSPLTLGERLEAKLLTLGLSETRQPS